jgi:hypothetical protein
MERTKEIRKGKMLEDLKEEEGGGRKEKEGEGHEIEKQKEKTMRCKGNGVTGR